MTLKRAGAPLGPSHDDETPEVPESIPRHAGNGRPKIRHADDPTVMSYWDRASGFGKGLESSFLIDRAENRQVVFGLSRRADLVELAQAVDGITETADKEELTRIAGMAKEFAGGNVASNRGTALHKLSERADAGLDLSHVSPELREALAVWRDIVGRFEIHATEVFVVCDRWEVAGTFDRVVSPRGTMTAPDGTVIIPDDRLIMDLKSGAWDPSYWGATYSAQQAIYAHAVPYVHVSDEAAAGGDVVDTVPVSDEGDNGRREWPDGIVPRTDWALIPHVPIGSPQDAGLWWVDLRQGALDADAAAARRESERRSNRFLPAELPVPVVEQVGDPVLATIAASRSEKDLTGAWVAHQDEWRDVHTNAARARLAELAVS